MLANGFTGSSCDIPENILRCSTGTSGEGIMGYSDSTLRNVNKVLDLVVAVCKSNRWPLDAAVPKGEIAGRLANDVVIQRSSAHRLVDVAVDLGLLSKSRPMDPFADKRLTFVAFTPQGLEHYRQGATQ